MYVRISLPYARPGWEGYMYVMYIACICICIKHHTACAMNDNIITVVVRGRGGGQVPQHRVTSKSTEVTVLWRHEGFSGYLCT